MAFICYVATNCAFTNFNKLNCKNVIYFKHTQGNIVIYTAWELKSSERQTKMFPTKL